jgi:hypothetical protein
MSSLELELAINKVGFYRSPNNIHSLPGSFWYAGGPGILTVPTSRRPALAINSQISRQRASRLLHGSDLACDYPRCGNQPVNNPCGGLRGKSTKESCVETARQAEQDLAPQKAGFLVFGATSTR